MVEISAEELRGPSVSSKVELARSLVAYIIGGLGDVGEGWDRHSKELMYIDGSSEG